MSKHSDVYDAAVRSARFAVRARMDAAQQYRNHEIDDAEFLEVAAAEKATQAAFDAAERAYIETCNELGEV